MFFSKPTLEHFLIDFGSIWSSKNHKKITISRKNGGSKASSEALLLESCFLDGFWSPWSSILIDFRAFATIFALYIWRNAREAFRVEGLASMIRATRGRSLDIWVDGWMDLGKTWGVRNYQKSKKIVCGTHVGFPYCRERRLNGLFLQGRAPLFFHQRPAGD